MSENNILGVILAGGKSKRFGEDKTIAKLGNKTLLDHTISKIEKNFKEIQLLRTKKKLYEIKKRIFNKRHNRRPTWTFSGSFVSYGMDKK